MDIVKKYYGGILRGRQHPSYYLLVTALCILWERRPIPYSFVKYKQWVLKQQMQHERFVRLGQEEIKSAYLEAREKIYKTPELSPIDQEFLAENTKQTHQGMEVMTDKKEIEKAHELINSIREDGVDGAEEEGGQFKLLTK